MFAAATGLPIEYGRLEPQGDDFEVVVRDFFAHGGCGLNVTAPFKERALVLASEASAIARAAGAANTLAGDGTGAIRACNTDGAAFMIDLERRWQWPVGTRTVVIIGAGGAAAGILGSLLAGAPAAVWVANRSRARAAQLVERFAGLAAQKGVSLGAQDLGADCLAAARGRGRGLVIQASSVAEPEAELALAGLASEADLVYDLRYGTRAKSFLRAALAGGAKRAVDGLGMLVEQAALSFAYWEQCKPDTESVYAALQAQAAASAN